MSTYRALAAHPKSTNKSGSQNRDGIPTSNTALILVDF